MSTKVRMPDGTWKKVSGTIVRCGTTVPVLEELTITENGEYTPPDGVNGFSKVIATVSATGGATMLSGSFTPTENTLTYTLTMPSPVNNFAYCMNPVEFGFGVRLNVGGIKINDVDFSYMGLSTNAAGTSAAGMTDKDDSITISEDGLTVTISENYVKGSTYLVPREYVWVAW